MNIYQRFLQSARYFWNLGLNDPKAWNSSLWGSQSLSGENVTEETALTYSAVFNAISLISGTIGSLPLHLMQEKGTTKRTATDYRIYRVMHDQWNPYMTAMAGRETMMAHILAWGNGYAEIVRNGYGEVVQLWPITPNRVTPVMKDGELVYEITIGPEKVTLGRDKVLHVPGLGFDGFVGYSVIAMARKSIGLGMAMETFGSLYFGKGTHPSAVITHPQQLKDPKKFRTAVSEVYAGLGNSNQLMVLEDGMKIEKIGIPPEDSQFLESRQFQIPEIARFFNLPPHKLKDLTRSSFSNIEQEQRSFYVDSLLPWIVRLEQNYNMQLLTESDKQLTGRGRLYFKHNAEGILRADAAGRGDYYAKLWGIGGITINEIRALEDMDPMNDPMADQPFVPLNSIPLSMLVEKIKKELEKPKPAPGEPKPDDENIPQNLYSHGPGPGHTGEVVKSLGPGNFMKKKIPGAE